MGRASQAGWFGRVGVVLVLAVSAMVLCGTPQSGGSAAARVQHSVPLPRHAHVIGQLPGGTQLNLTAALTSRSQRQLEEFVAQVTNPASANYRHFLQPAQFRSRFGATRAAVTQVTRALRSHGFSKVSVAKNGLSVSFSGTSRAVESTFHTGQVLLRGGKFTNLRTPLLAGPLAHVEAVFGLSSVQGAFSHATRLGNLVRPSPHAANTAVHPAASKPLTPCTDAAAGFAGSGANFPLDLADHYAFTTLYDAGDFGQGVRIGIQQYEPFTPSDIAAYQTCFGTSTTVNTVNINGGPDPSQPQLGEAALDIEVVIGQAPSATIDVYQAKNDGLSNYALLSSMVTSNTDQLLVTSWGLCENLLDHASTNANHLLYLEAASQGQSFIAAAGDAGSQDCDATPGVVGVDSPASQPSVLGVGGTARTTGADQVWNTYDAAHPEYDQAGGGGISTVSCMASYQDQSATVPGIFNAYSVHDSSCNDSTMAPYRRQVPDVSAIADPSTGYPIFHNGQWQLFGGTSAAAPLWASIGALIDASPFCSSYGSGFPGVQVASIYQAAGDAWSQMFTDVTVGNNDLHHALGGLYPATVGYDEASGLGTPLVTGLNDQGVAKLELPGLAARICHMAATTNVVPAVSSFTPSAILPGSPTTVTISGKGFLTIPGSTVVHLDADHHVVATCSSTTLCTFNSGSLSTKTYSPVIEVERLASSSTPPFTVTQPTATSLVAQSIPTATTYGTTATLQAVITPSTASGSVTFTTGATVLCTATLASGTASCLTGKSLGVGTYAVLASYGGGGPFASSSASTSLEVAKAPTTVSVSAQPAAPLPGASVTLTARITPADATGTVAVSIGNGGSCTVALVQGSGTCTASAPTLLGAQPVRAVYSGDALREASNATGSLTVQRAVSVTTMTRPQTAVVADGIATWSASVSPPTATGSVTFSAISGSSTTGSCVATVASGRASCSAAVLASGSTIRVTAAFSGSATVGSSSVVATYSVAKVTTSLKVTVSPTVVVAKKSFVISVSGVAPKATGAVTFKVASAVLCSAPLVAGKGSCSAKAQAKPGKVTVVATYPGDGAHVAATTTTSVTVR